MNPNRPASNRHVRRLFFVGIALLSFGAGAWMASRVGGNDGGSTSAVSDPSGSAGDIAPSETLDGVGNSASDFGPTASSTTSSTTTSTTTTTLPPGYSELGQIVARLTPEQKARQLVMVGFAGKGTAAVDRLRSTVDSTCIGGVFVARNWSPTTSAEAAASTIRAVTDAAGDECPAGPLISTDAEPGTRVLKVPVDPIPSSPDLYTLYQSDAREALRVLTEEGGAFASAIRELGVHVNFGVVADVDVDADYYMARQGRSFGADPSSVAALVDALVSAHCGAGVASTLKHFPNQGATLEDPHGEPSYSVDDREAFRDRGEVPYVNTSSPLVMTGHIFMDVDTDNPASLSSVITTGILRGDLGYKGVIVTDDLGGMAGVTGVVADPGERAVAAIRAGADLALYSNSADFDTIIGAITDTAASDAAFAQRVDEAVSRVLRLKASFGLVKGLDPSWFPLCDVAEKLPSFAPLPVVVVANGTTENGLAGRLAGRLDGLDAIAQPVNAATNDRQQTIVLYRADASDLAAAVAAKLKLPVASLQLWSEGVGSPTAQPVDESATVIVVIGADILTSE